MPSITEFVVPVDATGTPLGTGGNPLVVSGAPAGAATIIDGGDVCQGTTTDAAQTDPSQAATIVALLKGILTELAALNVILTDVHVGASHTIKTST